MLSFCTISSDEKTTSDRTTTCDSNQREFSQYWLKRGNDHLVGKLPSLGDWRYHKNTKGVVCMIWPRIGALCQGLRRIGRFSRNFHGLGSGRWHNFWHGSGSGERSCHVARAGKFSPHVKVYGLKTRFARLQFVKNIIVTSCSIFDMLIRNDSATCRWASLSRQNPFFPEKCD